MTRTWRGAGGPWNRAITLALAVALSALGQSPSPALADDPAATLRAAREVEAKAYDAGDPASFRRAADAMEAAAALNPGDLALRKSLGHVWLERLGEPRRALPHLERVVELTPDDPGWAQVLAKAYARAGDRPRAIATYQKIVAADRRNVWDRLELGKLLAKEKRTAEARAALATAYEIASNDQYVALAYAEFLKDNGERAAAKRIIAGVLEAHPGSAWGHGMMGDLYRAEADLARARKAYGEAIGIDPTWSPALTGLQDVDKAQRPKLASVFYRFRDTDGLDQAGLFNTLTLSLTGDVAAHVTFNARWFRNPPVEAVHRFEEALTLEYRPGGEWSAQAGVTAFQTEGEGGEVGGLVSGAWKRDPLYVYAGYRVNDPVNDSIVTAREAYTQDVLAGGAGVQLSSRLSLSVVGSIARYSDGNDRQYVNTEVAYRVFDEPLAHVRFQYEVFDYADRRPEYSSPPGYQIVRPLFDVRARVASWLWVDAKVEFPYVIDDASWGTGVTVGPRVVIGNDFEFTAAYFRYDIPGEFTTYSGEGFKVGFMWRY